MSWNGDFSPQSGFPPCYLQVNSFAFRAWNRGVAATSQPAVATENLGAPYGVWLFNGTSWFPDPTFPGSQACPGSTVLWAGKLDYWLVGSATSAQRTLCRFDGVTLAWEPISLPGSVLARLPVDANGNVSPVAGITSGACYAWDDCWFFGTDGVVVHWDGQSLSDASDGLGSSPWLRGDFTSAIVGTNASGDLFGLAVEKATSLTPSSQSAALPPAPNGSAAPQVFSSAGGPFSSVTGSSPTALQGDEPGTDLVQIAADAQGDVWSAGGPGDTGGEESPLLRLTSNGSAVPCSGYGAATFAAAPSYRWSSLAVFPDGSGVAGARFSSAAIFPDVSDPLDTYSDLEPAVVRAACGQPPIVTTFRIPEPDVADQSTAPLIAADLNGHTTALAANALNDAWAATSDGVLPHTVFAGGAASPRYMRPHLYHWTDCPTPDSPDCPAPGPSGDDNEPRPSLFTLGPPVYEVDSPTVVVTPGTTSTTTTPGKPRHVRVSPAIYAFATKLRPASASTYNLYFTFRVRRPVTVGLQALRGRVVVASAGPKRFTGRDGRLVLRLHRGRWPTRLKLVLPKSTKKTSA